MQPQEIQAIFDQQAATYDQQWARLAPVREALNLLTASVLSDLPDNARILCVGAGTGAEILYLAQRFPKWHFTAVDPSAPMLSVCRRRAEEAGIAARCEFYCGYLDSLPATESFDAATSILVSQFIVEKKARVDFFHAIAERLRPGGQLVSADLASDINSDAYQSLLEVWLRMMTAAEVTEEMRERMRTTYGRDVAVLPPKDVASIITMGGFKDPVLFHQAGLIHAWYSSRI